MNEQQAYEMMRVYLARPGAQQALSEDGCLYETTIRGELHRCAIGCLLTPETLGQEQLVPYDHQPPEFAQEEKDILVELRDFRGGLASVLHYGYELPEFAEMHNFAFIEAAQSLHDSASCWAGGRFDVSQLDKLAARHRLTVVTDEPVEQGAPREPVTA